MCSRAIGGSEMTHMHGAPGTADGRRHERNEYDVWNEDVVSLYLNERTRRRRPNQCMCSPPLVLCNLQMLSAPLIILACAEHGDEKRFPRRQGRFATTPNR